MFDKPQERILAIVAILLVGLLVFDRAVLAPVNSLLDDWDAEQVELQSQLAKLLPDDLALRPMEQHIAMARPYVQVPLAERQSQFSRFLEDQIPSSVRIEDRSAAATLTPISDQPDLRVLTYPLVLGGDLNDLRTVLSRLADSDQPLRINRLHVTMSSREPGATPSLTAEVRVSTLASVVAKKSPDTQPGAQPDREAPLPPALPALENMFARIPSPMGSPTANGAPVTSQSDRPFTFAGIVTASGQSRVMLEMREPVETRWVGKGDRIGAAELISAEADGAVFRIGGEVRTLKVGQTSEILHAGRRTFDYHCTLLGVCMSQGQTFALARIPGQVEPARLGIGDLLPIGRIMDIRGDALVVDTNGAQRILRIGQSTSSIASP